MSWLFASGGQSIRPPSEYSGLTSFRTLTGWISLQSKELSIVFSSSTVRKHEFDPFVVHEHDDWVFTLLRDMCLPANLVMTPGHYPSDVKKKKESMNSLVLNFMVQLSHPDVTTGETRALVIQSYVCNVMSLLLICCLGLS